MSSEQKQRVPDTICETPHRQYFYLIFYTLCGWYYNPIFHIRKLRVKFLAKLT